MDKRKSIQVSEWVWERLKQRALDQRVSVRDVVDQMMSQAESDARAGRLGYPALGKIAEVRELAYERDE